MLTGLAAYRPIAPPEDLADIDLLLRDFAQHAIDSGYVSPHGYFARDRQTLADRIFGTNWQNVGWSYAIIYAPLLYLAWQATGDARFLRQVEWWYSTCDTDWRAEAPGDVMSGFGHGWRDLYLPSLLMELDPDRHELWRSLMRRRFGTSRTGIRENGTSAVEWTWDTDTGERREEPAGFWSGAGGGRAQTGRSSILAMGCVMAQRWLPDEEMVPVARHILERLEPDTMRFIMPVPPEAAPPSWQIETELLDHDALTGWLRAYWEGRWRGYW